MKDLCGLVGNDAPVERAGTEYESVDILRS